MHVQILNYEPAHQLHFERLNRHWIEKYFWMEPIDVAVLQNPEVHILAHGGHILMAAYEQQVVGTVALKFIQPGMYEFTKMAVDETHQGLKLVSNWPKLQLRGVNKKMHNTSFCTQTQN